MPMTSCPSSLSSAAVTDSSTPPLIATTTRCFLSLFTIHHSPFTIHHSPFTIHHSPFTIHHSPPHPVLFFVVLPISAAGHVRHPLPVGEVPVDGLVDPLLEGVGGLPSQVPLDLGGVDGVAAVMPRPVLDESEQSAVLAPVPFQLPVHQIADLVDDVDVLPLIVAADVVDLAEPARLEDRINGAGVVLDVEPVSDVQPVARPAGAFWR